MTMFVPILIISLTVERLQITVRDEAFPQGYVTEALCKAKLAEMLALAQSSNKAMIVRRAECSRRGN